jgi:hypothetical protein
MGHLRRPPLTTVGLTTEKRELNHLRDSDSIKVDAATAIVGVGMYTVELAVQLVQSGQKQGV